MDYGTGEAATGTFTRHAAPEQQAGQKRLILMRHGDPENDEALKMQVRHAHDELFKAYPDLHIDAVLYSPVKRTVRTAGEFYRLHTSGEEHGTGLALPFEKQKWLKDDAGGKMGYDGLLNQVRDLSEAWNTVLLVTHSTTAPHIAKALKTNADDMKLVSSMFDYASVMVIDLPGNDWKNAPELPATLALTIAQPPPVLEKAPDTDIAETLPQI